VLFVNDRLARFGRHLDTVHMRSNDLVERLGIVPIPRRRTRNSL